MNADPDEGQPTTVPDTTAPEAAAAETSEPETAEAEAVVKDAGEADAGDEAGSEAEPEAEEAEAAEAEAETQVAEAEADSEAESAGADAADAEASDAEAAESSASEPEASADEPSVPEPAAHESPAVEAPGPPKATNAPNAPKASKASKPESPAPAASPSAAPASTTPLVAGRYRLVSEIGGGAMGVVWRARDEVLGRDVAVKELRPDHGMSGAQVRTSHQRARREGRIAARLQHPNAVVIYDVAEHDGRPYLIMEYVPSQSLGDILATGAVLTPTEVTSIGAQLASALTAAHERGIVHRDIKPGNVLMTSDGTVKLTDFGISRAAGDATVTATGEILGTPAYTAPEVAQGHPVAFPADVFSLGATLYAAVEGTPPFGEDVNAMALLLRVVRNEIRLPKRSGPLTDTIMWMLNPEPVDRPTMKEVWHGLDRLSAKTLPGIGIRSIAPETKPFSSPSPTLVVPEALALKSNTITPEPTADPLPAAPTPPKPTPTPRSISSRVATPTSTPVSTPITPPATNPTTPSPASTPTSKSSPVAAATPTSAMSLASPGTTGNSLAPKSAAAESPASTPPPTNDRPAVSPTSPPPARRSGNRRLPLAIAVCVVGTAVLIVAIVVAMNSGKGSPNQPVAKGATSPTHSTSPTRSTSTSAGGAAPTHASTTPSSSAPSTPKTPTTSGSTPTTSPSTSATDVATQLSTFLTNYYAMLPGNLDQAFGSLTPKYQVYPAGGLSGYKSWWGTIDHVELKDIVATAPSTVTATIDYYFKNGQRTAERTTFGLVQDGGAWKINTSSVSSRQPF